MQIIIPMSGVGKRFLNAGYKIPKPLIEVDNKPMIEHVVNLFPEEKRFIFICNKEHLAKTNMQKILKQVAPTGEIIPIKPHKKGPVFAVIQAFDYINNKDETIVNYCDFSCYWNYHEFLKQTRKKNADGAIPAYRNFHPHMLGTTNYAFIKEQNQWLIDIKEKKPFTKNRMQEYASNGTYYFKTGALVKKYFKQLIDEKINLNGEYYVSLVYKLMSKDKLKTSIYEVQHMLQWGTPQDLEEYQTWSNYFKAITHLSKPPQFTGITLIPLAGKGSRFSKEGYKTPKPLIKIGGKPMIIQAMSYLPRSQKQLFVCLQEHLMQSNLNQEIKNAFPKSTIITLSHVTKGQACTCEYGLKHLTNKELDKPLLIAACDNGMLWDYKQYKTLIENTNIDAIVWSFRNHQSSNQNPNMYGWIKTDKNLNCLGVSVKKQISNNPKQDHAIVGTFYFKKAKYFIESVQQLYKKNNSINNEFYVDSCINELLEKNLKIKVFEIQNYICWGTPNDLKTYQYWQKFFHKCSWHPYSLKTDPTVLSK